MDEVVTQTFTNLLFFLGLIIMPSIPVLAWISQYCKYARQNNVTISSGIQKKSPVTFYNRVTASLSTGSAIVTTHSSPSPKRLIDYITQTGNFGFRKQHFERIMASFSAFVFTVHSTLAVIQFFRTENSGLNELTYNLMVGELHW